MSSHLSFTSGRNWRAADAVQPYATAHHRHTTKTVLVTGADGHQVTFALAELDSGFTDRVILVADSKDGKPLPADAGLYQLVVPGEKRSGRWVRQIIAIDVFDPGRR